MIFDWLFGGKAESSNASGAAAATAEQREMPELLMPITEDPENHKDLIQVHTWTPSEEVLAHPGQFYCINMEEAGVDESIRWIRETRYVAPFANRRVPVIYLIGPGRALDSQELQAVNDQLIPTGAYYFPRPDYSSPFQVAMRALRDELARQYGARDKLNAWRRQKRGVTTP